VVEAPDGDTARRTLAWAEEARRDIQLRLFGAEAPPWPRPVIVTAHRDFPGGYSTQIAADGEAQITLWAGDPHLRSTVRHEVCHAVLHLRYPAHVPPRWLDEGLAVCQEEPEEQGRQLAPLAAARRRFSVRQLAGLRDYPRDVDLFYAQSYSLVDFLVRRHGEGAVVRFLEASFRSGQEAALRQALGYADFEALERAWAAGLPPR
jgi:hypothetical protein